MIHISIFLIRKEVPVRYLFKISNFVYKIHVLSFLLRWIQFSSPLSSQNCMSTYWFWSNFTIFSMEIFDSLETIIQNFCYGLFINSCNLVIFSVTIFFTLKHYMGNCAFYLLIEKVLWAEKYWTCYLWSSAEQAKYAEFEDF